MKSCNPINCFCKQCKTYIGGVGYIWTLEQYTPRDKLQEPIRNVGLFSIKEYLQSRFSLMLNIPIWSESFCSVFHAVLCKLLIIFTKYDKKIVIFFVIFVISNFNILVFLVYFLVNILELAQSYRSISFYCKFLCSSKRNKLTIIVMIIIIITIITIIIIIYVFDHWISQNSNHVVIFIYVLLSFFNGGELLHLLISFLCQNYFFYQSWFCLTWQLSLVLRNSQYYSRFKYHHSLIVLGID